MPGLRTQFGQVTSQTLYDTTCMLIPPNHDPELCLEVLTSTVSSTPQVIPHFLPAFCNFFLRCVHNKTSIPLEHTK